MKTKESNHFAQLRDEFLQDELEEADKEYEINPKFRAAVDSIRDAVKERYIKEMRIDG